MLIVDLSIARVVQHSSFQFYALPTLEVVSQIDGAVRAYAHAHAHDNHYLTRSKFNSILTENDHPTNIHTSIYIYIYIRIRGSLRLALNHDTNSSLAVAAIFIWLMDSNIYVLQSGRGAKNDTIYILVSMKQTNFCASTMFLI